MMKQLFFLCLTALMTCSVEVFCASGEQCYTPDEKMQLEELENFMKGKHTQRNEAEESDEYTCVIEVACIEVRVNSMLTYCMNWQNENKFLLPKLILAKEKGADTYRFALKKANGNELFSKEIQQGKSNPLTFAIGNYARIKVSDSETGNSYTVLFSHENVRDKVLEISKQIQAETLGKGFLRRPEGKVTLALVLLLAAGGGCYLLFRAIGKKPALPKREARKG